MEAPKNKGGRPTKAEVAARGIPETELKRLLALFKRHAHTMQADLISQTENTELSLKDRIKLQLDLLKMYESFLKTNKMLLSGADGDGGLDAKDPDDLPTHTVFRLLG